MLIKVLRALLQSGDEASLTWIKKWQGEGLVSTRTRNNQLFLEFSKSSKVLGLPELLTFFENGDPEDLVPVLYQLHRFYDTPMDCETDTLLTDYCLPFLKGESTEFKLPFVWECYNNSVLTTTIEGKAKIKEKKSKNALVMKHSKEATRFILLPCELLKSTLHVGIREKGNNYHGQKS